MSDVNFSATRLSAPDIEDIAADFLTARRDRTSWTDGDQTKLDDWLNASIRHQVAYFRLEAAVTRAERLRALKPSSVRSREVWPHIFKAAAALSIIAAIGIASESYFGGPAISTYQTSVGERETLSLADGSQIELNTDTAVRISRGPRGRKVWLDRGEAYFQIKHDALHPFVVLAGESRVVDLGTKFVLRRFSDHLEATLLEGSARVDASQDASAAHSVILKPGDLATVREGLVTVSEISPQPLVDKLGWRKGVLTFRYTTLADAAEEFNRYNQTKIVIRDERVAKLTIYGAFALNDALAFADAAQVDFKLRVENHDGKIILFY